MARKPSLRAVAKDERAAAEPPKTIAAAVDLDERTLLVALRAKMASEWDKGIPAHSVPQFVAKLREIDAAIRSIDQQADKQGSVIAETDDEAWDSSAI